MCSTLTILMFFVILPRCTVCICILLFSALECMYYNALYKSSYCIVLYCIVLLYCAFELGFLDPLLKDIMKSVIASMHLRMLKSIKQIFWTLFRTSHHMCFSFTERRLSADETSGTKRRNILLWWWNLSPQHSRDLNIVMYIKAKQTLVYDNL
jgi:hypothetical protein